MPVHLEIALRAVEPVTDLEQATCELQELRSKAADVTVDDPMPDVYSEAINLLSWQLVRQHKERRGEQFERGN